jgi:hypothetical protein
LQIDPGSKKISSHIVLLPSAFCLRPSAFCLLLSAFRPLCLDLQLDAFTRDLKAYGYFNLTENVDSKSSAAETVDLLKDSFEYEANNLILGEREWRLLLAQEDSWRINKKS